MIHVKQLVIYPVKSMQGISLKSSQVLASGLKYDRVFMVCEPNGRFITAREFPQLLQLITEIDEKGLKIRLPTSLNRQPQSNHITTPTHIYTKFSEFSSTVEPSQVWNSHFTAHIAPIVVNQFLSEFLQFDVQLRWIGNHSDRRVKRYPITPLGFADGYPYSLLNQASFDFLQRRCPEKLKLEQFRSNIIIAGSLPFAEDGWKTIKIGDVIFDIVKPCRRCMVTQINLSTLKLLANSEPLRTLKTFRQDEIGEIDFGVQMIARNNGNIAINDHIEILTRQPAKKYIKIDPPKLNDVNQTCQITINNQMIIGNCQLPLLEQLEQHNIFIPYSCRVGLCGKCRVLLKEGEVTTLTPSAIKNNGEILACSCIPKSQHLKIKTYSNDVEE